MQRALTALIATAFAASAFAADLPKADCKQPDIPNRLMASDAQMKAFNRHYKEYKECIDKFVGEQNAAAQLSIQAGNAAVTEFNDFAKKLNDSQQN